MFPLGGLPLGAFFWDEEFAETIAPFLGGMSSRRRVRRIPDDDEEAILLLWWMMQ